MITALKNGKYRARIYAGGVEVDSRVFERKGDAEEWELNRKLAVRSGAVTPSATGKQPFAKVADAFIEAKRGVMHKQSLDTIIIAVDAYFPKQLLKVPVGKITPRMLEDWYDDLLAQEYARSSVVRIRTAIRSIFTWAVAKGLLARDPVEGTIVPKSVRQTSTPVRAMSPDQVDKMFALARRRNENYAEILEFFIETGMRWGELVDVRASRYESVPRAYLTVSSSASDGYDPKSTKSNRARRIPLSPRAAQLVEKRLPGLGPDSMIFASRTGGRLNGSNFKRYLDWGKVGQGFRIHDLRHTAATRWLMAGIDVTTVSKWLGHSSPTVTMNIYSHYLGSESDRIALERLERLKNTNQDNDEGNAGVVQLHSDGTG